MLVTRHEAPHGGARWALDGSLLPPPLGLELLLQMPRANLPDFLRALPRGGRSVDGEWTQRDLAG